MEKWHKASEEMPEKAGMYLVIAHEFKSDYTALFYYSDLDKCFGEGSTVFGRWTKRNVILWRDMPEPPDDYELASFGYKMRDMR